MTAAVTPEASPPWRWPRIAARPALVLGVVFFFIGLWNSHTVWLAEQSEAEPDPTSRIYAWEITGAMTAYVLLPIVYTAAVNGPWPPARSGGWARFLGIHLAGASLYATAHVTLIVASRELLYGLLGWGHYHYGNLFLKVPMEMHKDLFIYVVFVVITGGILQWRAVQARRAREAELEARLRDAQLQALTGQLDPHFLFNALNTISSVMYEDLARTDRLLSDLGQLLRASLDAAGPTWTFEEERRHTQRYVTLLLARFGDRLSCVFAVDDDLGQTPVPRFLVQRLVENAIKHNPDAAGPRPRLTIRIEASRRGEDLRIEVADDGCGFADPERAADGAGVGLRGLRQSLVLLHGERAALETSNVTGGGARVLVTLPSEAA